MSFMYNPAPYDDEQAINKIHSSKNADIVNGWDAVCETIASLLKEKRKLILIDGYISADFKAVKKMLEKQGSLRIVETASLMKSETSIRSMLETYLPIDEEKDPAEIFGKLYEGELYDFFDEVKINQFLQECKTSSSTTVLLGYGSSLECFREIADELLYIDLTPKDAVLRAQKGCYANVGESQSAPFMEMMRRYYFVDVEILMKQRKKLVQSDTISYYLLETWKDEWQMMKWEVLTMMSEELSKQPFRSKPIYLEGVWGGEFFRKLRNIPKSVAPRIAWIFEFIPLEASILVNLDGLQMDVPFYTLLNKNEDLILGKEVNERFQGNFPIRFNYDDTWHSDGNMSIQCHPNKTYAQENFNEMNSQDEAYYVVATGHDAKTFCGFKESGEGFIDRCFDAQKAKKELDYETYVNAIPSHVGLQVLIPSGTIHASGRDQVVLELGSYTVGAYTFKMYDYNRQDLDGNLRPIHLYHAQHVLQCDRNEEWVKQNSAIEPIPLMTGKGWKEDIIGQNPYMYYETHRVHMDTNAIYTGENHGQFTVLSIVDGEEVLIYDKENPSRCYHANYLDVVTLPASIKEYVVEAKGYQPVVLHKTVMKEVKCKDE